MLETLAGSVSGKAIPCGSSWNVQPACWEEKIVMSYVMSCF